MWRGASAKMRDGAIVVALRESYPGIFVDGLQHETPMKPGDVDILDRKTLNSVLVSARDRRRSVIVIRF